MRYDRELKRQVPGTLGEYRSYFDDADPKTLGGADAKKDIMDTIAVLIDAAPHRQNSKPTADHTTMVRMIIGKAKELRAAIRAESGGLSNLEVLIEGAKLAGNPVQMIALAKKLEEAASSPKVDATRAAAVKGRAMELRQLARTGQS